MVSDCFLKKKGRIMKMFMKKLGLLLVVVAATATVQGYESSLSEYWFPSGRTPNYVTVTNVTPYPIFATTVRTLSGGRLDLPKSGSAGFSYAQIKYILPGSSVTLEKPVNPAGLSYASLYRDVWAAISLDALLGALRTGVALPATGNTTFVSVNVPRATQVYIGLAVPLSKKMVIPALGLKVYSRISDALAQLSDIKVNMSSLKDRYGVYAIPSVQPGDARLYSELAPKKVNITKEVKDSVQKINFQILMDYKAASQSE